MLAGDGRRKKIPIILFKDQNELFITFNVSPFFLMTQKSLNITSPDAIHAEENAIGK